MIPSKAASDLIKRFEGLRLTAYQDVIGVWTIGYGHTQFVKPGEQITEDEADEYLRIDMLRCGDCIDAYVDVPLSQNQYDALVSFIFNLGCGAFRGSTLCRLLNEGNYAGARGQFMRWNKAGGKVLRGLTLRREAEAELFGKE